MNPNSLDLNLVLALRALPEERNVTRAGQRIGWRAYGQVTNTPRRYPILAIS